MEMVDKSSSDSPTDKMIDGVHGDQYSVEDAIETIGFGKFHILMTLWAGFLLIADSMELAINSVLSPVLVCEWHLSSVQEAMISTVVFAGQAVGAIGWGYISDRYGRKRTLCASALIVFLFGIASSLVPFYWTLLLCRCFVGLGIGGIPQAVAMLTEMTPIQRRSRAAMTMASFWGIGSLLATALALAVVNAWGWRYYLLILSSPSMIVLIGSWWVPESPRFLLITKQMDKLNGLMQRIAKLNKKDLPEKVELEVFVPSRGRILDLFTDKFKATTILLFVMWFTLAFCAHGIGLLTTQMFQSGINGCHPHISENLTAKSKGCRMLTNKDYTDLMITSASETPTMLIVLLVIDKIGRKWCLTIQFGIPFISMMALLFCSSRSTVLAFIFIIRGALSSIYGTMYLYSAEVFPTNVRSVGLGCCSMVARFGALTTPFIAQVLLQESYFLAISVYAVPLILSVISSLLLRKETNQEPLEDSSTIIALKATAESYQTFDSEK